jgi:hypothetical protein
MSETTPTPYELPTECVVPEGVDLVDGLLVNELDIVSRQLGCDVMDALGDTGNGAGKRWSALPRLAWLWAKRTDPRAKLDPFLHTAPSQLNLLLGLDRDEDPAGDEDDDDALANPTDAAPAS